MSVTVLYPAMPDTNVHFVSEVIGEVFIENMIQAKISLHEVVAKQRLEKMTSYFGEILLGVG